MKDWKTWLHSLIAAAIGGATSAVTAAYVVPSAFDFSHDGVQKLGKVAAGGALLAVLALLKQSPINNNPNNSGGK